MGLDWSLLTTSHWAAVILWLAAAIGPLIHAWQRKTPMALGIGVSLLLTWLVQSIVEWRFEYDLMTVLGALYPVMATEPTEWHRFVTAAWLHGSTFHLLGNALVILLVGVPLEQRLGRGRYLLVYLIGALGGNIGWALANWGSFTPALGASGAAFGLLGCYLACWPRDEIEFPILLIRRWPVSLIALLKFGLEVLTYGLLSTGAGMSSNVAHLAHITGFFACYVLAKPIAKGGLVPIGTVDDGPSALGAQEAKYSKLKSRMGDLSADPWEGSLTGAARRTLQRLRDEGDEPETRQAWLEQLAEQATCPICSSTLETIEKVGITTLGCTADKTHLDWP
jgi:membrane associated rhomboid family serine protease